MYLDDSARRFASQEQADQINLANREKRIAKSKALLKRCVGCGQTARKNKQYCKTCDPGRADNPTVQRKKSEANARDERRLDREYKAIIGSAPWESSEPPPTAPRAPLHD
jgi:hypothetical protein